MPEFECGDCGLVYQSEHPDSPAGEAVLCTACWENDGETWVEAPDPDFEPDLIGSQWYHEDLP